VFFIRRWQTHGALHSKLSNSSRKVSKS